MATSINRTDYAAMFGPTVGDKIRLADTDLIVEVEHDLTAERTNSGNGVTYGEEVKFGGGADSPFSFFTIILVPSNFLGT